MTEALSDLFTTHREPAYLFFRRLRARGEPFIGGAELAHEYAQFLQTDVGRRLDGTVFHEIMEGTQEAVVSDPLVYLGVREQVGQWWYLQIHADEMSFRDVEVSEFLEAKERAVIGFRGRDRYTLEVDLAPFERGFPRLSQARSIGRGVEHLNRYLSGRLFREAADGSGHASGLDRLVDFLRVHHLGDQPLMLNGSIGTSAELMRGLRRAVRVLEKASPEARDGDWIHDLRLLGFEPGWGRTPARVLETMNLLLDLLEAPEPRHLAEFLARIPMITSIAILSPHGYFGQANVLGKPDTGGQVVYILDQVRALEHAMRESLYEQGLDIEPQIVVVTRLIPDAEDTTCDERIEPILGTRNARILRVPFRSAKGEVLRPWISRFEIWPYLERFAVDAQRELLAELGQRPDFVLGNYSDGNLVATIIAHRLGVTQCNIAHALEKTKYPNSDVHWKDHEAEHHFACQYTADLIAMNTADFIIASTYQEIAGTSHSVGQYESYQAYTLPGLYRVVSGIDCFDPKFNIVSPGANPEVFFPYSDSERRTAELEEEIRALVFDGSGEISRGHLAEPAKPLLFAMSRLDHVKNMPGLLESYGRSERLQELANLLLVGGWLDPARSSDADECRQIERMHELLDRYQLDGRVRWIEMQTDKNRVGEFYRVVADTGGAFVQPALFEAFGLTVVEAMSSGLPVFVTRYGGPSEIVQNGVSGFHIDPVPGDDGIAEVIIAFLERTAEDPGAWAQVSEQAITRVRERYNWPLYASRLLELSRIYGFWRYITTLERDETRRYLEMFYALMYRPLARRVEERGGGAD